MRDWAFAIMIALIFIAFAGCTATGLVSSHNTQVEMKKLELEEMKLKNQ